MKHKTLTQKEERNVDIVLEEIKRLKKSKAELIKLRRFPYVAFFYSALSDSNKTIMVSNLDDGWITLSNVISRELKCEYYFFSSTDDNIPEPGNYFKYVSNGLPKRVVYSIKDGSRWVFHAEGNSLLFEDQQHYTQKLIKKRLTKQILIDYCKKLGLLIEDKDFWKSAGVGLYHRMGAC